MRRILIGIHRHKAAAWVALLFYACAVTFPHQWVQDVVGAWGVRITNRRVYEISAAIALIEAGVLSGLFFRMTGSPRSRSGRTLLNVYWLIALAMATATWGVLTANNTELVHYPQYFPEGICLLALTFSPAESLAWTTLLASFDEGFQYIFLMRGRPAPFDFNDVYMDLGGAAAGIVFAMAVLGCARALPPCVRVMKKAGILALAGVFGMGIVLWATGRMALYEEPGRHYWFAISRLKTPTFWYFQPLSLGPHHFHELTPIEGPILIIATIALFAVLDHRLAIQE